MKKVFYIVVVSLSLLLIAQIARAAPTTQYFYSIAPTADVTYDNGASLLRWAHLFAQYASTTAVSGTSLCIGTDCRFAWPVPGTGTVTSIATNNGLTGGTITTTGTVGLAAIAANSVLGNITGSSAVPSAIATSSLFLNASASNTGLLTSTDWSIFNGKQAAGNYITALTGDVTASGPGSVAATLATVNANVGSFGGATSIPTFTVNGKGLITAASAVTPSIPVGDITGILPIANGGTATTTGGNTNGVEYYNGSTLTNSTGFTFTGTNVGIGTTSPTNTLEVNGPLFVAENGSGGGCFGASVFGSCSSNGAVLAAANDNLVSATSTTGTNNARAGTFTAEYDGATAGATSQGINGFARAAATVDLTSVTGGGSVRNRYAATNVAVGHNVAFMSDVSGLLAVGATGSMSSTTWATNFNAELPTILSGSSLNHWAGLYVHGGNPVGSIGDAYGVYIEQLPTTATSSTYGIYQAGTTDKNYLAGSTLTVGGPTSGVLTNFTLAGGASTAADTPGGDFLIKALNGLGNGGSGAIRFSTAPGVTSTITNDATSQAASSTPTGNTMGWTHTTTAAANSIFYCVVSQNINASHVTSMTYTGVSMTKLTSKYGNGEGVELWYVLAPTSGANQVVLTDDGTAMRIAAACRSASGVNQTNPWPFQGTPTTGTSVSTTDIITTQTGTNDWLVDAASKRSSLTTENTFAASFSPTNSQTKTDTANSAAATYAGESYVVATTTTAAAQWTWTSSGTTRGFNHLTAVLAPTGSTGANTLAERLTILPNGNVGIGSSTPFGLFSIQGSGGTAPLFTVATSTGHAVFSIGPNGHVRTGGPAPALSSCGVTPTLATNSNDISGTINVGSGVTTACTMTFAVAYDSTPVCTISDNSTAVTGDISSISTSAVTFGFSATLGSGQVYYQCSAPSPQ